MRLGASVFETEVAQPLEKFTFTVDFDSRLSTGEEITSEVVKYFDKAGVDKTADIENSAPVIQDGRATKSALAIFVKGLLDGERYNVQIVATTTASVPQELEVDVFIPVRDIKNEVAV